MHPNRRLGGNPRKQKLLNLKSLLSCSLSLSLSLKPLFVLFSFHFHSKPTVFLWPVFLFLTTPLISFIETLFCSKTGVATRLSLVTYVFTKRQCAFYFSWALGLLRPMCRLTTNNYVALIESENGAC